MNTHWNEQGKCIQKVSLQKKFLYRKLCMYRMSSTISGAQKAQLRQQLSNQAVFAKWEHLTGKSLKFV